MQRHRVILWWRKKGYISRWPFIVEMGERFMKTLKGLRSRTGGAMLGAMFIGGIAMLSLSFVAAYVLKGSEEKLVRMSQADAKFLNELVFSRVGQAVAATALLCDERNMKCKWNSDPRLNLVSKNFGFSDLREEGNTLKFDAASCLPADPEKADFSQCVEKESTVSLRIQSLEQMKDLQIFNWSGTSDTDVYGILISIETAYESSDSNNNENFVSNAIIRRPRFFAYIEPGSGECLPTCHVPLGQTRVDAMCYGPVGMQRGQTNLAEISGLTVRNDGPGYIYALNIERGFSPNPAVVNSTGLSSGITKPTSVFNINEGLAPGAEAVFNDNTLECAHETINRSYTFTSTVNAGFNGVSSSTSYSSSYNPNSSTPTGTADYRFASVAPSNALFLDQQGAAVPSTQTINTTVHTVIVYRGQN
jgi:hypothetical protein